LLVRSKEKIEPALKPFGIKTQDIDAVQGDVLDRISIEEAAKGCDATVHCGSVYSLDPRASKIINNTNVKGTENVIDIANSLAHDPIIHISSIVALIGTKDAVLTPDSLPTEPTGAYLRSKADSDRVARKFQEKGVPVVITYPGSVWGPYDPHFGESCQIARNVLKGIWKMSVKGSLPISDVREIAKLHASLVEKGKGPRRYIAPMQNVTLKELVSTFSYVTGKNLDTIPLPRWALLLPMKGLDSLQKILPLRLPFNFQAVYTVSCNNHADDSITRKDFGISPRPLAETLKDQINWMAQEEYITPSLAGTLLTD
jgi:nucleoside-diphosphate-sugar epimerase